MNLTIPIYVAEERPEGTTAPVFVVRPVFFEKPAFRAELLSQAMGKLAQELRKQLDGMGKSPRQDELVRWTFSPHLEEHPVQFSIEVRKQTRRCRFLVLAFEALGRKVGFAPAMPELWFDLPRGRRVRERAEEALSALVRRKLKDDEYYDVPAELLSRHRTWVTTLEIDVATRPDLKKRDELKFLMLGQPEAA